MAPSSPNSRWLIFALLLLVRVAGGCCEAFPVRGEQDCRTDARRIYCGAGEEAVRRGPCGADRDFYGHKPTDWRTWPEGWRLGQYPCSTQYGEPTIIEQLPAAPSAVAPEVPNPFRNKSAAEELPPAANVKVDDAGEIDFDPAQPAPATTPAPAEKPAPATTVPNTNQDWRSAADEIMQSPTFEQPPKDDSPDKPSAPPADTVPPTAPPKNPDEDKSSSAEVQFPTLIAAQNGEPQIDSPARAPLPPAAIAPGTISASAWGPGPKAKPTKTEKGEQSVNKRVAKHLSHSLSN